MTKSRTALSLLTSAALLAACSKGPANQTSATASGAPATAASSGPDVVIDVGALPHPRTGLWETTSGANGEPPTTSRHCETGETVMPKEISKSCSQFQIKRTFLGDIVIDASCGRNGVGSTMHVTVHGDFNSAFASDGHMTMTMPGRPPLEIVTHSEAHYVGPCPPGGADG